MALQRKPKDLVDTARDHEDRVRRLELRPVAAANAGTHTQDHAYIVGGLFGPRGTGSLPQVRIRVNPDGNTPETKSIVAWEVVDVNVGTCDVELYINNFSTQVGVDVMLPVALVDNDDLIFLIDPSIDAEDMSIQFSIRVVPG